jgi:hypothetical protein
MNETTWVAGAPKGYKVEALKVKPKEDSSLLQYDHWTFERLDNSNETDWVASSPMATHGYDASLV